MTNGNWQEARRLLTASVEQERQRRSRLDWRTVKAGSSADILFPVIGEALQAFWAVMRGELRQSFWWHYGKARDGMPVWDDWSHRRSWRRCTVCSGEAGLGDLVG
jgi:hypothetical protein